MKTQCPNCKAKFNTNDASVGKQAKCPKCAKPFTIEPFIETPVAEAAPAERPEPVETPAKIAEPVKTPVKIAEPVKQEKPESKPLSKTALSKIVFVYCWTGLRIIAGVLAVFGLMLAIRKEERSTLLATFAAADVFLAGSVLIELLLFYKMWAAIKDSHASITPGKAVGFLLIPVFNIYWALCMIIGFAEDYNSFIHRRSIKTKNLPMTLFMIYAFVFMLTILFVTTPMICVFAFLGLISRAFIGYPLASWLLFSFISALGIGHFITYLLVSIKTCNAINALP